MHAVPVSALRYRIVSPSGTAIFIWAGFVSARTVWIWTSVWHPDPADPTDRTRELRQMRRRRCTTGRCVWPTVVPQPRVQHNIYYHQPQWHASPPLIPGFHSNKLYNLFAPSSSGRWIIPFFFFVGDGFFMRQLRRLRQPNKNNGNWPWRVYSILHTLVVVPQDWRISSFVAIKINVRRSAMGSACLS